LQAEHTLKFLIVQFIHRVCACRGQLFRKCICLFCVSQGKVCSRQVFAGQAVGIKEIQDDIWLVSFMDYDLGYFDLETRVLEPLENPFGPKVLPMS
jgi:hypothetical protein